MIDVNWLAENGPCKIFLPGHTIPCPGVADDSTKAMYILLVGRVDVSDAGKRNAPVLSLFPGDVFGGFEYFAGTSDKTYTAVVDSVVYVVSESSFNDLSWSQPDILFEVLRAAYQTAGKITDPVKADKTKQSPEKTGIGAAQKQSASAAAKETPKAESKATASAVSTSLVVLPETIPLFPEGHKLYPGITRPEYERLVYKKEYTCPFCRKVFTDYRVSRSKLYEASPMRYDLRKNYTDFQTEWYDIITCQSCLFSMFHNYFTEPKPIHKPKIENELYAARASVLLDFDGERNIDYVFTAHYLALLCAEGYITSARQLRAKLWGNLSWLYEDVEDEEMVKFAAAKAASAYEDVYTGTMLNPTQEQVTCLSIAGMQYRAGIDNNLKKFLFSAKTSKSGDRIYSKIAEDFMEELGAGEETPAAANNKKKK